MLWEPQARYGVARENVGVRRLSISSKYEQTKLGLISIDNPFAILLQRATSVAKPDMGSFACDESQANEPDKEPEQTRQSK